MIGMASPRFYSAARVGQLFGVSRQTVWEWTARGKLPAVDVDDGGDGFRVYVADEIDWRVRARAAEPEQNTRA